MPSWFRTIPLIALLGVAALLAAQAHAGDYEYKLFQFHTNSMNSEIDNFSKLHPEWELVSMTALDFQDQGTVSILFLARRRITVALPPGAIVVPAAMPPSRVEVVTAPQWASSSGYAQAAALFINGKLPPSDNAKALRGSAVVDVVIDSQGKVLLADVRSGKVDKTLANSAVAATQAASPFGPLPDSVDASSLTERAFSFRVNP